jgi:hypothetical protein
MFAESSVILRFLPGNRGSNWRLIRPRESSRDEVDESAVALKSKVAGFRVKLRLVRSYRQLMLHEGT